MLSYNILFKLEEAFFLRNIKEIKDEKIINCGRVYTGQEILDWCKYHSDQNNLIGAIARCIYEQLFSKYSSLNVPVDMTQNYRLYSRLTEFETEIIDLIPVQSR